MEENGIKYFKEKTFPWLRKNKNSPLFLDFYLPDYNILIECQGKQHFTDVMFFGGCLNERIMIDTLKHDGAIENGFQLLYYTDIKNVKTLITQNIGLKLLYDNNLYTSQKELLKQIKGTE